MQQRCLSTPLLCGVLVCLLCLWSQIARRSSAAGSLILWRRSITQVGRFKCIIHDISKASTRNKCCVFTPSQAGQSAVKTRFHYVALLNVKRQFLPQSCNLKASSLVHCLTNQSPWHIRAWSWLWEFPHPSESSCPLPNPFGGAHGPTFTWLVLHDQVWYLLRLIGVTEFVRTFRHQIILIPVPVRYHSWGQSLTRTCHRSGLEADCENFHTLPNVHVQSQIPLVALTVLFLRVLPVIVLAL